MEAIITLSVLSFTISFFAFKFFIQYAKAKQLLDLPNERKLQKIPVPTSGGIPLYVSVSLVGVVAYFFHLIDLNLLLLLLLGLGMMILGFVDDRNDISAKKRVLVEVLISLIVTSLGYRVESLHSFLGIHALPEIIQYVLSIFLILAFINAFNLIDGIDGLLGSISLVNFSVFAALFYTQGNESFFLLSVVVVISLCSFLIFNFDPAKIFMGDAGSLVIGFLTACFGFQFLNGKYVEYAYHLTYIIALALIPLFDTFRVIMIRVLHGESPFTADKSHVHHYLIKFGYNHRKATIYIVLVHLIIVVSSNLLYPLWGIRHHSYLNNACYSLF